PPGKVHRLADELMKVLTGRKSVLLINDLANDKTFSWLGECAKQLIAVPLQRQDQVLGCLFGIDKLVGDFDSVDSKLLNSIANESAIYLENVKLFEDVHGLRMGLLHSLTSAVDAKDAYTCRHHERYDGKGYPSGLAGDNSPLMGRIICLADCFDAMTSNRTYRKALPLEVALGEIRRCSGTQFDPRLAEAFLRTGCEQYRELLRDYEHQTKRLSDLQQALRSPAAA